MDSQTQLVAETEAAVVISFIFLAFLYYTLTYFLFSHLPFTFHLFPQLFLLSDGQKKCMLFVGKLDPSPQSQQAKIYAFGLIGLGGGGGNHQQEEEEAAGNASFSYKLTLGNSTTALTKTYEGSPLSLNLLPRLNITAETRGVHFCDEATFQQLLVNGSLLHIKVSLIPIITLD